MNPKDFRRLLRALLVSAGSGATVGCGGASPTEMPERATCTDLSKATRYTGLTLSPGVDGIAFATRGSGFPPKPLRLASLGAPCATAKDPPLQLALENAAEGCVREAYGALVAAHQASHARDPEVRAAFARIAVDEGEHAELSFALDAWLRTLLTPSEQQQVDAAIGDAWRALEIACAEEPAADVRAVAGVPTARGARAILAQLGAVVGAAA